MAILFENVSVLVLGTDDEGDALEDLTDMFPRYMIVRIDSGLPKPDQPETITGFHAAHENGYIGPHEVEDMQANIVEGLANFGRA